ncbi:FAD-dependent monooxygenase [Amycolatopsis benzoatilytica]|uniref:FAD-dependent monooxygenase n=1 Tax=Amycolatopsis benzoatilytica TaxID=346045 RepID=UPI00035DB9C6|nr:FAD-dependent monooxygenase [Amycolatopsis benzoatilytica]
MTVLVVGAGPTGLSLACGLLVQGVPVRVVDSAAGPAATSRALGLQPRGQEVLRRLGAFDGLPQRAVDIRATGIHVAGRKVVDVGAALGSDGPRMLWIPQTEVEARLRARLAELGGSVEWGVAVRSLVQDADGVDVELAGGERLHAAWAIGCDGAHSQVRKSAGIGFPGASVLERFLLADVHLERAGAAGTFLGTGGQFVAMPLPHPDGDLWRLMAPAPDGMGSEPDEAEILRLLSRLAVERAGFTQLRVKGAEWTSVFRFHRRLADSYRSGRMLLAGDAAHIHSPLGGQGLNTGIGDAENLAFKLALVISGRAGESLLDTYTAERRPVAKSVLAATSFGTKLGFAEKRAVQLLFAATAPVLRMPIVQRRLLRASSQLGISYRHGPLAAAPARRVRALGGPRAGDRMPNIWTRDAAGRRGRLHDRLEAGWALLASGTAGDCARVASERLGEANVRVLAPETGSLPEVCLVRPDAHLAWRGTGIDELTRWLDAALAPGRVTRP